MKTPNNSNRQGAKTPGLGFLSFNSWRYGVLAVNTEGDCMIKADLVDMVARETKITKTQAERAVNAAIESLRGALMDGKRIELRGFGVFQVKPRKRGIGRNPRTKEEVEIPPGKTIRFKPGKNLQNIP